MTDQLWSWLLGAVGLLGFYLAGRRVWWAWYVNIGNQVLWIAYSIITQQLGFLVTSLFFTVVFVKNAIEWTKTHNESRKESRYVRTEAAVYQARGSTDPR